MKIAADSPSGHILDRVRRVWAELDYAQRRLMEIRTGIPFVARPPRLEIEELESLYAYESPTEP